MDHTLIPGKDENLVQSRKFYLVKLQSHMRLLHIFVFSLFYTGIHAQNNNEGQIKTTMDVDACVYAASPAGVMAAVALARDGYSVAMIEPTHIIGGLLASGFRMQQDVPDPQHLGGLTRDYYDK